MLTDSEIRSIESLKGKKETMTPLEKQNMYRIRGDALKALKDLTYLADNLPEKQLNQIFNESTFLPLVTAVLHRPDTNKKRVCKIIMHLIGSVLGNAEFASRMVPKDAGWIISKNEEDPSKIVEALFFASMCYEKPL